MIPLNFKAKRSEIYLDNAATTVIDPSVVDAMQPYLEERYGNPETLYHLGREAKEGIDKARAQVADMLKVNPEEIYFTSGGTEANNWALKGFEFPAEKQVLVISAVEHKSVLAPANWMMNRGLASLYIAPVDAYGMIRVDALEAYLKDGKVGLVSVQFANNEVGTLQPVKEIGLLCKKYGAVFHCDAVQGFGKIDFTAAGIGADMITLSGHKIHGPMGVGALWVKVGTKLEPLLHGGGHESGKRSGTHGVPQIVGFGKAAELAWNSLQTDMPRISQMVENIARDMTLVGAVRNGHPVKRLPNILNMSIPGENASLICGILAKDGICVSTGAACSTKEGQSHVLMSMGRDYNACVGTFRISLSRYTKSGEGTMMIARLHNALREAKIRDVL
jgi:cysteine desulfurase